MPFLRFTPRTKQSNIAALQDFAGHLLRRPSFTWFFVVSSVGFFLSFPGTSHGTWPTAAAGYYPTTSCNYGTGTVNGGVSTDTMYHHHHSHHQANPTSYSPQAAAADHHSLGWSKSNKDVTTAATWSPECNYSWVRFTFYHIITAYFLWVKYAELRITFHEVYNRYL